MRTVPNGIAITNLSDVFEWNEAFEKMIKEDKNELANKLTMLKRKEEPHEKNTGKSIDQTTLLNDIRNFLIKTRTKKSS